MLQSSGDGVDRDYTLLIYFWGMPGKSNPFDPGHAQNNYGNSKFDPSLFQNMYRNQGDYPQTLDDLPNRGIESCAAPLMNNWKIGNKKCSV